MNFAPGKIPSGGKSPQNVHIMYQPRKHTAKHRAKFGWPPVIDDVAAVTKRIRETR